MDIIVPGWKVPGHIKAISTTKVGGISLPPFDGLNLGMHVGDDPNVVKTNRDMLVRYNCLPATPVWLDQTHSTVVARIDTPQDVPVQADGAISSAAKVVCCVMTADCLPILLTDIEGSQVAAVHAGWRGLANGIIENAVRQFDKPVLAWLGPAIGANAFEVGHDVFEAFTSHDPIAEWAFRSKGNGKYLADMFLLATQRLKAAGVKDVVDSGLCTYSDPKHFYSYRREGITGRQASLIWIEK
ncbi:peptidoglycan editing factor PgeF [Vibrio sp. HA2012]|uniref:peptidoglycan editing factor PgeF n=1 Tax=Vibrio sp. HA2012 TaxID=1971595 RepID=UPI000C2C0626|nr:peptidoglycan editing factor PgeF [Vibrio sp. HA2012]PJC85053.1 peptidoglycan editing factor PgeF [Vibrio sp. HA2012]